jgi:hypothetical protein
MPKYAAHPPINADYLVGTANSILSAEIAVGTTPGGELGGSWATPTVDATHSGSAHVALTANTPAAVGTSGAVGTGTASAKDDHVHAHEAAHINHDTTWAAKGDLIAGTANDTASVLAVGADDTLLVPSAAAGTGLKYLAVGFGHTAATHAVSLSTASAFATATTSVSAATYADVTGVTVTLATGTWLVIASCTGSSVNAQAIMHVAITDASNVVLAEGSQGIGASGTASVAQLGSVTVCAIVSATGAAIKMRAARGLTTITGTWVAMDGAGTNTSNNLTDNSDKGTGIFAVRIA